MLLEIILNALTAGFCVSSLYAQEQEVTAGGITNKIWQVFLQYIILINVLAPLSLLYPLVADNLSLIGYGGLLSSALIAYGASIFQSNQRFLQMNEPRKIQKLPYNLHNSKSLGKMLMFVNEYLSTFFVIAYLGGLLLCGLNGFGIYALTSAGMGLFDRIIKRGWLPEFLNAPYRWLMIVLFVNLTFGVTSTLWATLTALFVSFTIWDYVQTHIRGVRSSSWQFPKAEADKTFKLSKFDLHPTNKDELIKLARTLQTYEFKVTYDHFRASHVVTQKILSNAPNVQFSNFTELFERINFSADLLEALGAEITSQDKYFNTPREDHLKNFNLPEDASNNDIYKAYLKTEIAETAERLTTCQSRDLFPEAWIRTKKQARVVLSHLIELQQRAPDDCARALVDLALKTGSHCNRVYANTFSTLFEQCSEETEAPLSLEEKTSLAAQRSREEAFKKYYYHAVPQIKRDMPIFNIDYADINDFHSFNNFAHSFGQEFYLSNNNGIRSARDPMDAITDWIFFWYLSASNQCFNKFYNVNSLIKDILNPEHALHTCFKEWCDEHYLGAYNEIILDEDGMPDLENEDIKRIAIIMLLDLNIIELNRPYEHPQSVQLNTANTMPMPEAGENYGSRQYSESSDSEMDNETSDDEDELSDSEPQLPVAGRSNPPHQINPLVREPAGNFSRFFPIEESVAEEKNVTANDEAYSTNPTSAKK